MDLNQFLNKPGGAFLMNLLAQSGYSTMPDSPLGAVGRAQLATRQQGIEQQQLDQRSQLNDAQVRLIESRIGANNRLGGTVTDPSAVREFKFVEGLTPEQRERYMLVKRAGQFFETPGAGRQRATADGGLQTVTPEEQIVAGMQNRAAATEAGRQSAITGAIPGQVQARTQAESQAAAREGLGAQVAGTNQFIEDAEFFIDALESGDLETGLLRGQFPAFTTEEQLFEAFSGEQVLSRISEATFGALSEGEREFLRRTVSNRTNTPEANIRLLRRKIQILQDADARARDKAGVEQPESAFDPASMTDDELRRIIEQG